MPEHWIDLEAADAIMRVRPGRAYLVRVPADQVAHVQGVLAGFLERACTSWPHEPHFLVVPSNVSVAELDREQVAAAARRLGLLPT